MTCAGYAEALGAGVGLGVVVAGAPGVDALIVSEVMTTSVFGRPPPSAGWPVVGSGASNAPSWPALPIFWATSRPAVTLPMTEYDRGRSLPSQTMMNPLPLVSEVPV